MIVATIGWRSRHCEQASAKCKLVDTMPVCQQAIVANAMKAIRQDVEEEAASKLGNLNAHHFALMTAALPGLFPAEPDVGLIKLEQAIVSDGDTMRVPSQ